jgi:hypothetical protein
MEENIPSFIQDSYGSYCGIYNSFLAEAEACVFKENSNMAILVAKIY